MTINLRKLSHGLVLLALIMTPIFSYGELIALLQNVFNPATVYTPAPIKLIKDAILALILLVGVVAVVHSARVHWLVMPFGLLVLYGTAAAIYSATVDPYLALVGIRWIFPILVCFALLKSVDEQLLQRVAGVLVILLGAHVVAQVIELFFMGGWYGTNLFGLAGRVPGIFMNPNAAGFFTIVAVFFIHFYRNDQRFRPRLMAVAFVSVLLTQSGTALIVYTFLVLFLLLGAAWSRLLLPIAPVLGLGLFWILPVITGRNQVQGSGLARWDIFLEIVARGEWFPQRFGAATNGAIGLGTTLASGDELLEMSAIADSTYASIAGNLGLLGLLAFLAGYFLWLVLVLRTTRADLYAFTLIFTCYGATLIFLEAFPMNLLFAIMFAHGVRVLVGPLLTTRPHFTLSTAASRGTVHAMPAQEGSGS